MSQRLDRVDELLRQEIGAVLAREINDPRIGFVTITRVETTPDLSRARVWVSVIGTPEERAAAVRALEHAMPFVRRQLGSRIRIRRIPELHVRLDESIERGTRVLKLLDAIEAGDVPDPLANEAPPGRAESLPTPVARLPQEGDVPDEPVTPSEAPDAAPSIDPAAGTGRPKARAHRPRPAAGAGTTRTPRTGRGTTRRPARGDAP